jgi:hypothetical protein
MHRIRTALSWVLITAMFGVFTYGMVRFPDAPIRPCAAQGYCGKQGQPRTYQDYVVFSRWQTTLMYLWPTGIVALVLLRRKTNP